MKTNLLFAAGAKLIGRRHKLKTMHIYAVSRDLAACGTCAIGQRLDIIVNSVFHPIFSTRPTASRMNLHHEHLVQTKPLHNPGMP